jgi:hypothetical protein
LTRFNCVIKNKLQGEAKPALVLTIDHFAHKKSGPFLVPLFTCQSLPVAGIPIGEFIVLISPFKVRLQNQFHFKTVKVLPFF